MIWFNMPQPGGSPSGQYNPQWNNLGQSVDITGPADFAGSFALGVAGYASSVVLSALVSGVTLELATLTDVGSLGHKRSSQYRQNANWPNTIPSPDQIITRFNQLPWVDGVPRGADFEWMRGLLKQHGIDVGNSVWESIINFSHNFAPLGDYLYAYYRGLTYGDGSVIVSNTAPRDDISRQLRRLQLQGKTDRELILNPPWKWSVTDALRLTQSGLMNRNETNGLLRGAGFVRNEDLDAIKALQSPLNAEAVMALSRRGLIGPADIDKRLALAGILNPQTRIEMLRLQWSAPSGQSLLVSSVRHAFDEQLAARYGLDDGIDRDPLVRYWMRADGLVGPDGSPAPGAHDGPTDWMKYYWRGAHPLIGFETALELQYRLRPAAAGAAVAVHGRGPAWTGSNTLDMLRMAGYSETMAASLQGLTDQPLNIRLINHVLSPFAHHADVRGAAAAAFGVGVDWVKEAMLDHGFSDAYATVAAAGIHAQADDREHQEKIAEQKVLRKQHRDLVLKRYAVGLINNATVLDLVVNDQYDAAMATDAMRIINESAELSLAESHLAAVKEGYMAGKLSIDQVGAQMTAIGVSDFMKIHYIQEWAWTRSDNPRMLATKQILAALKTGLLTPQLAMARLTNLGWTQADALVEIAQIEQEVLAASQHQRSAAAAKQIAAQMKAQRQEASAAKVAERDAAKSARAAVKAEQSAARVPLEGAVAGFTYDGKALLDFDAYNKASKAGDVAHMQAELDKATAAYAEVLLKELKLRQANPGVAGEVLTAKQIVDPTTPPSAGAGKASASVPPAAGGTPAAGGGTGPATGP